MKWVEFTQTVQYESEGRNKGPIFTLGERHHFEDAFAERWLRRGVAKLVDGPRPAEAAPASEPAQPAETAHEPDPPPAEVAPPQPKKKHKLQH